MSLLKFINPRLARVVPDLVADSVFERPTQVGRDRPIVPGLEPFHVPQGPDHRVLDDVVGIHETARPCRETSGRPPAENREVALAELPDRLLVTRLCPTDQLDRRHSITPEPIWF